MHSLTGTAMREIESSPATPKTGLPSPVVLPGGRLLSFRREQADNAAARHQALQRELSLWCAEKCRFIDVIPSRP